MRTREVSAPKRNRARQRGPKRRATTAEVMRQFRKEDDRGRLRFWVLAMCAADPGLVRATVQEAGIM